MAVTATYDPLLSRIRLAATSLGATAVSSVWRRSVNNFVTYDVVRGGTAVIVTGGAAKLDDYEFPPGVPVKYQVESFTATGSSAFVFEVTITQDLPQVWLKVPAAPYLNRAVAVEDRGPIGRKARGGLFEVVGRTLPVAVGDVSGSSAFTLQLVTETATDEINLDAMFASGEIIYVQRPAGVEHFPGGYFTVGDATRDAPSVDRGSPRRYWDVPLTEVAAPGPDIVGSSYTIASVLADYATVSAMMAANATIAVLLERVGSPVDVIVP